MKFKFFILISLFFSLHTQATLSINDSHSKLNFYPESNEINANSENILTIEISMDKGWHTYWINPGDSGDPAEFEWELPEGFQMSGPIWPSPDKIPFPPLMTYGFDDQVILPFILKTPKIIPKQFEIGLKANWLVCKEICIPQSGSGKIKFPYQNVNSLSNDQLKEIKTRTVQKINLKNFKVISDKNFETFNLSFDYPSNIYESYFFPYEYGFINYAEPQNLSKINNSYNLEIQKAIDNKELSLLSGVLSIKTQDGVFNYEIKGNSKVLFQESNINEISFFTALLFALIGGLILNLMPCVFPVLSLKIFNFIEKSDSPKEVKAHGLIFASGAILTFLLICSLILLFKYFGVQVGWGFQLQSPIFLTLLIFLFIFLSGFFISSLNLNVAFTGNAVSASSGYTSSFFTGFLAVIVATPCTAPFMGSALGLALLQPSYQTYPIFLSLALGFCLPYLVLSFNPRLISFLPKPGPWMENLKQFMAFPMGLTAIWLFWILSAQLNRFDLSLVLVGSLVTIFIVWLSNLKKSESQVVNKVKTLVIILSVISLAFFVPLSSGSEENSKVEKIINTNDFEFQNPTFVNFTADWCITCKVNEARVLKSSTVLEYLDTNKIDYIVYDWTERNENISAVLESYGRSGVPLYLLFKGDGTDAIILPEILTETMVLNALRKL